MQTRRLIRPSLALGHAAVAMLALAAIHVALPTSPQPKWHAADQALGASTDQPRRLPASRRADRALID